MQALRHFLLIGDLVDLLHDDRLRKLASTVQMLTHRWPQDRKYVRRQGQALHAESLGRVLTAFLQAYFPNFVDYGFSSTLEAQLDEVSGALQTSSPQPRSCDTLTVMQGMSS